MPPELQECLEQEFADFEKGRFNGERFWRVPLYTLRGTLPYTLFGEFSVLFPDDPNEHRDVFYLLQSASGDYSILFRFVHFEHASSKDLPALARFIDSAAATLTSSRGGHIELLDGNIEQLHIRFYSPHEHIVALLQRHATRTVS
jgi:hypothetical protein